MYTSHSYFKMRFIKAVVVIFLILVVDSCCNDKVEKESENEDFVPTDEWQSIKKGQKIPKGLHVRINFETGVTEAKLLDKENNRKEENALLALPQDEEDDKLLETDVIKEALKKIKSDTVLNPQEVKKIKNQFRTYDEIKKEMKALNMSPKIDAEILNDLFKQYKDVMEKETLDHYSVLRILEDYDFLAHQFDNALEFIRQDGFRQVIYKNLNLTDSKIKEETLKLFGSLVQNNAKVQIHALETGAIGILLRILTFESSTEVKSRAVFALSCLLRRFPFAQLRLVENGGVAVILKLTEKDPLKIQIKLVTLMNDLVTERIQAFEDNKSEQQKMLYDQYKLVNLKKMLLEQGWCKYLNKLLLSLIAIDPDDHDSIERCAIAMHTVASECFEHFDSNVFVTLQQRYRILAKFDSGKSDEYSNADIFTNMHDLCLDILQLKNKKTELYISPNYFISILKCPTYFYPLETNSIRDHFYELPFAACSQ